MKKSHPLIFLLSFIYFIFNTTAAEFSSAEITQTTFTAQELLLQQSHLISQNFPAEKIKNLIIKTTYETLEFSDFFGSEISVDIYSNNNTIIPEITLENTTLAITSAVIAKSRKATIGDNCKIVIYIPKDMWLNNFEVLCAQDFTTQTLKKSATASDKTERKKVFKIPQIKAHNTTIETISTDVIGVELSGSIVIKTKTGNITLENIGPRKISKGSEINQSKIQVYATTNTGTININNFIGNYMSIKTHNNINASNITCNFFEVKTTKGNISIILDKMPVATSKISTNSGLIQLFIPQNSNFTLNTKSSRGTLIDKIQKLRTPRPNNTTKNYNDGGPIINLETTTGNIEIEDF